MADTIGILAAIDVTKIEEALKSIDKGVEKISTTMDTMVDNMEKGFNKVGDVAKKAGEAAGKAFNPESFNDVNSAIVNVKKQLTDAKIDTKLFEDSVISLKESMKDVAFQPNLAGTKIKSLPSLSREQTVNTTGLQYEQGLNIPQLNQAITILENYRSKLGLVGEEEQKATDLLGKYKAELKAKNLTTEQAAIAQEKLASATRKKNQAEKQSTYEGSMGMSSSSIEERIAKINALKTARQKLSITDAEYTNKLKNLNQEQQRLDRANKQALSSGIQLEKQSDKMKNTVEALTRRVALEAIVQNKEASDEIFTKMQRLAVISPFQFKDLMSYTKQLAAFRIETSKLYDKTKMLADVSAGLGVDMSRLILAYGQVRAAAVLRGQEIRQFTEAGIPLLQELSQKFSELEGRVVSTSEVFEKVSKREVPFEMVDEVFQKMTVSGGVFYNMQEIQAETLKGKISNLTDSYEIMLNKLGEEQDGALKGAINSMTLLINNYETLIDILRVVGITYGALFVKRQMMILALGREAVMLKGELLLAKKKEASDLMAKGLTQQLTKEETKLIATRHRLTDEDKMRIVTNKDLTQAQAKRLLYFGRLKKEHIAELVSAKKLDAAETLRYRKMNAFNKVLVKTAFLAKTAGKALWNMVSSILSPANLAMAGFMLITSVVTKMITKRNEWKDTLKNIETGTRESLEGIQKSYKDVAKTIEQGVKSAKSDAIDEKAITKAIIAIQGLANNNETLNSIIQQRLGYYETEAERLIELKKILDDYIYALEVSNKNSAGMAIATDTGGVGNEGLIGDLDDLGDEADNLTKAFVLFQKVGGSALDAQKEKFALLKEEGLGYAETIKFINDLSAETDNIKDRGDRKDIQEALRVFSGTYAEAMGEFYTFWNNYKTQNSTFKGEILQYDKEYYGLSVDNFKAFTTQVNVAFAEMIKNSSDGTKKNAHYLKSFIDNQINSYDPLYQKSIELQKKFIKDTKSTLIKFNGEMVDYSNKTNLGLTPENYALFTKKINEVYTDWMIKHKDTVQGFENVLSKMFSQTFYVKYDFKQVMADRAGDDLLAGLNSVLEEAQKDKTIKLPKFKLGEGEDGGIGKINQDISKGLQESTTEVERLKKSLIEIKKIYDNTPLPTTGFSDNKSIEEYNVAKKSFDLAQKNLKNEKERVDIYTKLAKYQGLEVKGKDKTTKGKTEDLYLKKLKEEIKLIEDVRKAYQDLEKAGYGKDNIPSLMPKDYNPELQRAFGKGMNVEKLAGFSKDDLKAFYESLRKGLKTTASQEELNIQLSKLNIEVSQDVIDQASNDLNNSISKIQDGLSLAKELKGFDVELREVFKKLFDYEELELDQALQQLNDSINKELQSIGAGGIDMSKVNLTSALAMTGISADSKVGGDMKKAYDMRNKMLQDNVKETADNYKKLLEKYSTFEDKQVALTLTKNQELADLNKRFNTEDLQNTEQYLKLKAAIEKKYAEESANLSIEAFKDSELWSKSFDDLDRVSSITLESLMRRLEEMIEVEGKAADATKMKDLMNSYKKMRAELEGRNPFKTLTSGLRDYISALKEQKKINEEIKAAEDKLIESKKQTADINGNIVDNTEGVAKATEALNKAQGKGVENGDKRADAAGRISKGFEAVSEIGKTATDIASGIMGTTTGVQSEEEERAADIMATIGGVMEMSGGVAQIMSGNIMGGITAIAKGAFSIVSAWADNSNNEISRAVAESEKEVQRLTDAYAQLERAINESFGSAELTAKKALATNLKLQKAEIEKQLALEKSRSGKNQDEEKITELENQLLQLDNQIEDTVNSIVDDLMGGDIKSVVGSFADTVVSAMTEATDSVDALNKSWSDMILGMIKSQLVAPIVARYMAAAKKEIEKMTEDGRITEGEIDNFMGDSREWSEAIAKELSGYQSLIDRISDLAQGSEKTSTLQKGIQSITEQTAQALEGLLNSVRFEVFNHTDLLTNISDRIEIGNVIASNLLSIAREGYNLMKEMRLWQESITWTGHNKGGGKGLKVFAYTSVDNY
jgi:peptidoglycan hydrolase-like protein with peptidoglycan-binding domain